MLFIIWKIIDFQTIIFWWNKKSLKCIIALKIESQSILSSAHPWSCCKYRFVVEFVLPKHSTKSSVDLLVLERAILESRSDKNRDRNRDSTRSAHCLFNFIVRSYLVYLLQYFNYIIKYCATFNKAKQSQVTLMSTAIQFQAHHPSTIHIVQYNSLQYRYDICMN